MSVIPAPVATVTALRPCLSCHREWGAGVACQFCRQVEGLPAGVAISSPGKRLGAHVVDGILMLVTLFVGWLIWALIVFAKGQTPGKQLLGMKVARLRTGTRAGWGTMFARECVAKPVIGLLSFLTFGVVNFWLIWDKNNQELWDKVVATVVVDDSHGQL